MNLLPDYDTGTFVPVITTAKPTGERYSAPSGSFTRVGRVVHLTGTDGNGTAFSASFVMQRRRRTK